MPENDEFKEVFATLPRNEVKFLIGMTHFNNYTGGSEEAIIATTGLPKEEVEKILRELQQRNLIEQGKLDSTQPHTYIDSHSHHGMTEPAFISDPNGNRFRLREGFKDAVLKHFHLPRV